MSAAFRRLFRPSSLTIPMSSGEDGGRPETTQASHIATRRSGYTNEEVAFKDKYLKDLDPSLPIDRRVAAAYQLTEELQLHSVDSILQIWTVAEDLTTEHAPLNARKAGFALLKACASHSGILHERLMLFHMIVVPIHPSEASLQISALDRLTRRGTDIGPFETDLITFLNSALDTLFWAAQDARKLLSSSGASRARSSNSPSKDSVSGSRNEDDSSRDGREDVGNSKLGEERSLFGAFYLVEDVLTHNPDSFQDAELEILIDRITSIATQTTSRKTLHGVAKILRALTSYVKVPLHSVVPCLSVLCTIYKVPKIKFQEDLSTSLANLLLSEPQANTLVAILIDSNLASAAGESVRESQPLFRRLSDGIFTGPSTSEKSRCAMIKILSQLFREIRLDTTNKKVFEACLQDLCAHLGQEQIIPVSIMNNLSDLAATCGPDITNKTFDFLLSLIEAKSGILVTEKNNDAEISDQTVDCLIRLFLRCHPESAFKTARVYKLLILAAGQTKPTTTRLSVMKLLARLRCTSEQAVEVVLVPDSQGLAGTLCRTEATASSQQSTHIDNNRQSVHEQPQAIRQGRSSAIEPIKTVRSRSATRSSNLKDQFLRPMPPLWMYNDWTKGLPEDPRKGPSQVVYSSLANEDNATVLDLAPWLEIMINVLKDGSDWEIYSYVLVHLPSQLSNRSLFSRFVGQLQILHNIIIEHLEKSSFTKPPSHTKMTAGDVALCLYHTLTVLVAYHKHFGRRELDSLVRAFSLGISKWDRAGRCCIHALTLCCHEMPSVIDKHIFVITQKLSQKITQSDLAIDILEFLANLARVPEACLNATAKLPDTRSNTTADDALFFKTIFGICIGYVRTTREQRLKYSSETQSQVSLQSPRQSSSSGEMTLSPESRKEFPEYVYALAHQVVIFWFLAIDVSQRAQHVGWIAKELAWHDASRNEVFEEQSQVILDMMHRTAFSDLGETEPVVDTKENDETTIKQIWLLGMSIVTIAVSADSDFGQVMKRQASGTTHATYRQNIAKLPAHHVRSSKGRPSQSPETLHNVFPNHILLQLTSTIAPVPIPLQPIKLPDDEFVQRVLRNFDRTDTVDGHKAGVIYIDHDQSSESDILANTRGNVAYETFLSRLGTKVVLQDATFNTQGLDKESNLDGTHTYAWRDRVTEMAFHVTTMMPTDTQNDPKAINKKRHIGNDRVKIIFNNSGKPFVFDTFPSEMNEVNIVITPEAQNVGDSMDTTAQGCQDAQYGSAVYSSDSDLGYYKVEALHSSNTPPLSAAATPKVVSADALPGFVRQLALNASVFSQVWSELLGQGEYISNWRARLKEIKKLREKYGNTHTSANISYPMPADADAPTYNEGDGWNGKVTLGGMTEPDKLLMSLDFTRWG